jgi:glycosidase
VNVAAQDTDPGSLLSTYRGAISFRQSHPALLHGATFAIDTGAESVSAWLRATEDDLILTVFNFGTAAVSDYGLSLDTGPLCGVTAASSEWAIGDPTSPAVAPPGITAEGGLDDYQPIGTLAAQSGYLIELAR